MIFILKINFIVVGQRRRLKSSLLSNPKSFLTKITSKVSIYTHTLYILICIHGCTYVYTLCTPHTICILTTLPPSPPSHHPPTFTPSQRLQLLRRMMSKLLRQATKQQRAIMLSRLRGGAPLWGPEKPTILDTMRSKLATLKEHNFTFGNLNYRVL